MEIDQQITAKGNAPFMHLHQCSRQPQSRNDICICRMSECCRNGCERWPTGGPGDGVPVMTWLIPPTTGTKLCSFKAHFLTSCNFLRVSSPQPLSLWTSVSQQGMSMFQLFCERLVVTCIVTREPCHLAAPCIICSTQTEQLLNFHMPTVCTRASNFGCGGRNLLMLTCSW